ncbi:MAG: hypothetical protein AAGL89_12850 [Pseudomonadota bacterium]
MQNSEPQTCRIRADVEYDTGERVQLDFRGLAPSVVLELMELMQRNRQPDGPHPPAKK